MTILDVEQFGKPTIHPSCYLAPGSQIAGDVSLDENVSIWFNAAVRADGAPIRIAANSNIQDNVSCHVDDDAPLTIGRNVSVGHNAVVHGCTIEDDCLIGMSATVMSHAVIGAGSLVAAGALVLEGTVVPPGSLVAGVPAKVKRALTDEEKQGIVQNAEAYLARREAYVSGATLR